MRLPAGRAEQIARDIANAFGQTQVVKNIDLLLKCDPQRIVADDGLHPAAARLDVVALCDIGADQAIKNQQQTALIRAQIFNIRAVVHAMSRWRIDNAFERTQFRNPFHMNPELTQQVDREREQNDSRRKS